MSANVKGIRPNNDNQQTLGDGTHRYQTVYASAINDGVQSTSVAEVKDLESRVTTIESNGGGGGSGVSDHTLLTNRSVDNQHPMSAITGLNQRLTTMDGATTNAVAATAAVASDLSTLDQTAVKYDSDGNITYPAGLALRVSQPSGLKQDVLATDSSGNAILGERDIQVNIVANQKPTIAVQNGAPSPIATMADIVATDGVTQAELAEELAYKADLVGGKVPASQMPPGAIPTNYTVTTESQLVTLTAAIPNDRAKVTQGGPDGTQEEIWLLWAAPATVAANWENITALGAAGGGAGTGVESVNGMTGAVTVDLANMPGVQAALGDKANASDLAGKAPLASPTFTGTPMAPTPPVTASGMEIMTAAAVRTAIDANFGTGIPAMNGVGSPGSLITVSRSDHVHPTDISRAPIVSPIFSGNPQVPNAPAGDSSNSIANTAFVAGALADIGGGGSSGGVNFRKLVPGLEILPREYNARFFSPRIQAEEEYFALLYTCGNGWNDTDMSVKGPVAPFLYFDFHNKIFYNPPSGEEDIIFQALDTTQTLSSFSNSFCKYCFCSPRVQLPPGWTDTQIRGDNWRVHDVGSYLLQGRSDATTAVRVSSQLRYQGGNTTGSPISYTLQPYNDDRYVSGIKKNIQSDNPYNPSVVSDSGTVFWTTPPTASTIGTERMVHWRFFIKRFVRWFPVVLKPYFITPDPLVGKVDIFTNPRSYSFNHTSTTGMIYD